MILNVIHWLDVCYWLMVIFVLWLIYLFYFFIIHLFLPVVFQVICLFSQVIFHIIHLLDVYLPDLIIVTHDSFFIYFITYRLFLFIYFHVTFQMIHLFFTYDLSFNFALL